MTLPEITLDDRRFQDLVNEARIRIHQTCPEWTEHNVSDPGITLIEAFAWMTDMLLYRVNRIPDRLQVALLDMLGIRLESPVAATTELRFRMSDPAGEDVRLAIGDIEAGTVRTASEDAIIFQTTEDFTIPAARPTAYVVHRGGTSFKDVGVAGGWARPNGADRLPFATPPAVGDAFYLGFDCSLERLLVQLEVDCSQARGAGVDPDDPPLRWEVSTGDETDDWSEAAVLIDRTGGFNYGSGIVELALPPRHAPTTIAGQRAFWVRCRIDKLTRSGVAGASFSHAPEIFGITAAPIGATIPAAHSTREPDEMLGRSDGTPGQRFRLRNAPVLELSSEETLEVLDPDTGQWNRWELRESFVESGPDDAHFGIDLASGEVEFGPAIRSPGGAWRQYGAIPAKGALLRFSRYRHGGGRHGNVAAGTVNVLKGAIPGVSSVTNPAPALGGVDAEALDSARERAAMEIRTRYRAVTAEDFEFLCGEASPAVGRAHCVPPQDGGSIRVHIVPRVDDADRRLALAELTPGEALLAEVSEYLDERRLIGTSVDLVPARLRGLSVVTSVQASPRSDLQRVEEDVAYALYAYLNPLVGGTTEGLGTGWEFGRALNQGELFGIVHSIDGVDFVKILRVYETDLATGKQDSKPAGGYIELAPDELVASGTHIVKAEHRES